MAADARKLLEQLLGLPPDARAGLAASLIEIPDEAVDEDVDENRAQKLERRIRGIDSGAL